MPTWYRPLDTTSNNKRRIFLPVFAILAIANAIAIAGYLAGRGKPSAAAERSATTAVAPAASPAVDEATGLARARRIAGIAALEHGDYDAAVTYFEEAMNTCKAAGTDVAKLLQIARDLKSRTPPSAQQATTQTTITEAAPEPVKPAVEPKRPEKLSARERERERERQRRATNAAASRPAPKETADNEGGTIVVSSTPAGLAVQVDGRVVDTTPARFVAAAGEHHIVLLKGSETVFERRVVLGSGGVQAIDADLSERLSASLAPAPQPAPAPAKVEPVPAPPPQAKEKPKDDTRNLAPGALYVLASKGAGLTSVSREELVALYLGRSRTLNGRGVEPIMRSGAAASAFLAKVLQQNGREYRDNWQKAELAGRGIAPRTVGSIDDIAQLMRGGSSMITYAMGSELDDYKDLVPVSVR